MNICALSPSFRFLSFLLLLGTLCGLFMHLSGKATLSESTASTAEDDTQIRLVILDAGHGGEDGGAIGINGAIEKEINLSLTLLLRDLLVANGVEVILTRETDTLLYDKNADYHGRKKMLDLTARKEIAEAHPQSVFVSIHMNTYPLPDCQGLQVWYSPNDSRSMLLADQIQQTTKRLLQPTNNRRIKAAGSGIYLLHHIQSPAVLIECGFLSNPQEAEKLSDATYQKELALVLFLALMQTALPDAKS